ncbi:MAG: hypothetical protein O2794_01300 [bacterium]|nr:hypothetical protein [bacterium]
MTKKLRSADDKHKFLTCVAGEIDQAFARKRKVYKVSTQVRKKPPRILVKCREYHLNPLSRGDLSSLRRTIHIILKGYPELSVECNVEDMSVAVEFTIQFKRSSLEKPKGRVTGRRLGDSHLD